MEDIAEELKRLSNPVISVRDLQETGSVDKAIKIALKDSLLEVSEVSRKIKNEIKVAKEED